jgi:peptidoglycan/LPS O-acetylase OafA/YrhL
MEGTMKHPKNIIALTGTRFFAALGVFLSHCGFFIVFDPWFAHFFLPGPAVSFFFVLSGFILALNYESWFNKTVTGSQYTKFLQLRFARIYPIYLVGLVILLWVYKEVIASVSLPIGLLFIVSSISLSIFFFSFIEVPARRWVRNKLIPTSG